MFTPSFAIFCECFLPKQRFDSPSTRNHVTDNHNGGFVAAIGACYLLKIDTPVTAVKTNLSA